MIDFDLIINNPRARVCIDIARGRPVVGFLQSEITIFGRNELTTLIDTSAQQDFARKANIGRAVAQSSIGQKAFGAFGIDSTKFQNVSLLNLNQTIGEWTASAKPVFTLNMIFVALRTGDDVRIPCAKLLRTVYPTVATLGSAKGINFSTLRAPLNYAPTIGRGFSTIQIGQWFKAPRQVIKEVTFTFSTQVVKLDPTGSRTAPLFAIATLQFEPFRLLTYPEIRAYIFQDSTVSSKEFFKEKKDAAIASRATAQEADSNTIGELIKKGLGAAGGFGSIF